MKKIDIKEYLKNKPSVGGGTAKQGSVAVYFQKDINHKLYAISIYTESNGQIKQKTYFKDFAKICNYLLEQSKTRRIITFDLKNNLTLMQQYIDISQINRDNCEDLKLSYYLTNNDISNDFSFIVSKVLGVIDFSEHLLLKKYQVIDFKSLPPNIQKEHLFLSSKYLYKAYHTINGQLYHKARKILDKIDKPLVYALYEQEQNGFLIDIDKLEQLKIELSQYKKKIIEKFDINFNLLSSKQVLYWFLTIDKNIINEIPKTAKGNYKLDKVILKKLSNKGFKYADIVLLYREIEHTISSIDINKWNYDTETHKLYPHFNETQTKTGRLSSDTPNIQNFTNIKEIKELFIAPDGYKMVSVDYSQIELRIATIRYKEPLWIDIYKNNGDIHQQTADLLGIDRKLAKQVNFSIIYGVSPYGLSDRLNVDLDTAINILDTFNNKIPNIMRGIKQVKDKLVYEGYITTIFGRKLYYPDVYHNRSNKHGIRSGVNAYIQGSGADIFRLAIVKLHNYAKIREYINNKDLLILGNIHDELLFYIKTEKVNEIVYEIQNIMNGIVQTYIPFPTDYAIGNNWAEVKDVNTDEYSLITKIHHFLNS